MVQTLFVVNAHLMAKPGCEERLKASLEQLVRNCQYHKGLLVYRLHQDLEDPTHFVFYEQFASREDYLSHSKSEELASFRQEVQDLLEGDNKVYRLKTLAEHK